MAWNWPDDIVDETRIFEELGYRSDDPRAVGTDAADIISRARNSVEMARVSGRIRRLSAKNPTTGAVAAYGYRRADVRRILGLN